MTSFQKELRKRKGTYDRIIEWKELADKYKYEIRGFIFRWISFNGLYSASYEMDNYEKKSERVPEWKIVKIFCDKFILNDKVLVSKIYSDDKKKIFEENIKEKSNFMGEYLNNLKSMKTKEEQVKYMVMIAYKIRCRLFHGEKNPNLEVNQLVIKTADQVIETILNHFIKEKQRT